MNDVMKAKAVVLAKAMSRMGMQAINVSRHDLDGGTEFLTSDLARPEGVDPLPLISSNLVFSKTEKLVFPPYLVVQVGGIQVGIFGVMDKGPANDPELNIVDPVEAAKTMIAKLKGKCDLVIGLVALDTIKTNNLAKQAPGADILVVSDTRGATNANPLLIKKTLIAQAGKKGQFIGRMDLTLAPEKETELSEEKKAELEQKRKDLEKQRRELIAQTPKTPDIQRQIREIRKMELEINKQLKGMDLPFTYKNTVVSIDASLPEDPEVAAWVEETKPKPGPKTTPAPAIRGIQK